MQFSNWAWREHFIGLKIYIFTFVLMKFIYIRIWSYISVIDPGSYFIQNYEENINSSCFNKLLHKIAIACYLFKNHKYMIYDYRKDIVYNKIVLSLKVKRKQYFHIIMNHNLKIIFCFLLKIWPVRPFHVPMFLFKDPDTSR